MTICYFGIYNTNYTRNKVNIDGLRLNGATVIECRTDAKGLKKYWILLRKGLVLCGKYDVMIVGFNGHAIMPVAWLVAKLHRKPVIFDAFISTYDSNIFDRKKHSPHSLMALKYWLIDWLSCSLADLVLMDAEAHARYMIETFRLRSNKVKGLLVGCPDDVMYPRPQNKKTDNFLIHFHGTYIPLQGIPYIIRAAKILENQEIEFNIVGKLSTYSESIDLSHELGLQKVNFYDYMPYEKLAEFMASADVCLGAFGDTDKAKRMGIFKIIEAMAMKKPVITADTIAMREFLTNRKDVLFCKIADSQDLADKIMELKNNQILREAIAEGGYELYKKILTPKSIGYSLLQLIETVI